MRSRTKNGQNGAALVEFALLALVLYVLIFGGIELGRQIFVSQVLQEAARLAARELSLAQLPANETFEKALTDSRIFSPTALVIRTDCAVFQNADGTPNADYLTTYLNGLPLVNRALRPVYISDNPTIGATTVSLLRYPGALLWADQTQETLGPCPTSTTYSPSDTTGLTVGIPRVTARGANGLETIDWVPLIAEARSNPNPACADYGLFPLTPGTTSGCGADSPVKGVAAAMINYPFQSAALSGFQKDPNPPPNDPLPPNVGFAIDAAPDDTGVTAPDPATIYPNTAIVDPVYPGVFAYSGKYGLGSQYAFAKTVRPYRVLLTGQAVFRREVIQ